MGETLLATSLLLGGSAIFGGAASAINANQQNRAASRTRAAAGQAAAVQSKQVADRAAQDRLRRIREQRRLAATSEVIAASSGFDVGSGDVDRVLLSLQSALEENVATIGTNLESDLALIESERRAAFARADASVQSPFAAAFSGLAGGANTGLTLLAAGDRLTA